MTELAEKFAQPTPVDDVLLSFPARVRHLMPAYSDALIKWARTDEGRGWVQVQRDWFYNGLQDVESYPKAGVDPAAAWRHLKTIQGSFEPKHEHKEIAVAYLMSLWFDRITYTKPKLSRR